MLPWVAALAFLVAFALVRLLAGRFAAVVLDRPNERSLHEHPVPRTGGLAVLAGVAAVLGFIGAAVWLPVCLALLLAVVSLLDDVRGLPTSLRLAAHSAAACVFVWLEPVAAHALVLLGFVFAMVWLTNLYNFMDGSDGLAGGMAAVGFGAYGAAAWLAGQEPLAALSIAIAAAALAFLTQNFHPARIFLGDVGSIPLGFLAGALGVQGWQAGVWPLWFPLLVFGPFIGDATITLLKRFIRGARVWQAHREHYYQRMVRMGLGHRGTAAVAYILMLLCAGSALLGRNQPPALQAMAFVVPSAVLAVLAIWVDRRWTRFAPTA